MMKNLGLVLQLAIEFLKKHKVPRARFVAETLLAHFLKYKRIELYMHFDAPLVEKELEPFRAALKRVITGEPYEYILGEIEFFGTKVKVGKGALIPRQETEILLDLVCKTLDGTEKKALDLCTGTGCLAAALKNARPEIAVTGVDISEEALQIARQNHSEVTWLKGDLTTPVKGQKFDLVICNPPYVTSEEYATLDRSVKEFEPKMALVSGPTGLEFYERLSSELPLILNPGAKVFFEIGMAQGEAVQRIFSKEIWENQRLLKDWASHDRFFHLNLRQNSSIMV